MTSWARKTRQVQRAAGESPSQGGFSLLEMLVVLTILALVVALTLPSFRFAGGDLPALAAARQAAAKLRLARSLAMRRAAERDLLVDAEARRLWIAGEGGALQLARDLAVTATGRPVPAVAGRPVAIRFFPDGSSSGGRVRFQRGGRSAEVVVDWITGGVDVVVAR